ncbi:hypothetical protein K1719_006410 [Acacia pycnantha]|nr:hypothetical protein K1719_006410 [Acacia pycnantha]
MRIPNSLWETQFLDLRISLQKTFSSSRYCQAWDQRKLPVLGECKCFESWRIVIMEVKAGSSSTVSRGGQASQPISVRSRENNHNVSLLPVSLIAHFTWVSAFHGKRTKQCVLSRRRGSGGFS